MKIPASKNQILGLTFGGRVTVKQVFYSTSPDPIRCLEISLSFRLSRLNHIAI